MITQGEIQSIQQAIERAQFEINRQENELRGKQNFLGRWLFPDDEQVALNASKEMIAVAINQRNLIIEDSDWRHEEALQIIDVCNHIATPGRILAITKQPSLAEKFSGVAKKIVDAAIHNPVTNAVFGPIKILLIVVGLVAAAYLVFELKSFGKAIRRK